MEDTKVFVGQDEVLLKAIPEGWCVVYRPSCDTIATSNYKNLRDAIRFIDDLMDWSRPDLKDGLPLDTMIKAED